MPRIQHLIRYVGALLILGALMPAPAKAQSNDSLVVFFWQSTPGDRPGFLDDLEGFGRNRLDANGDGVAEIVSVETNENGQPGTMYVTTLVSPTGERLQEGDVIYELSLTGLRALMISGGLSDQDIAGLRFMRFVQLQGGTVYPMLFRVGNSAVFYFPEEDRIVTLRPPEAKLLALQDFDGDNWPEIVVGVFTANQIKIFTSAFAPGG